MMILPFFILLINLKKSKCYLTYHPEWACRNRAFLVWLATLAKQVPLGLALTWAFAFLLTESKVYTYSGCSFSQQGNMTAVLTPKCQEKMATMRSCRTDLSNALSTSAWFRFPYPFQWGVPTFHWQTAAVMMVASVIASVDSVSLVSPIEGLSFTLLIRILTVVSLTLLVITENTLRKQSMNHVFCR